MVGGGRSKQACGYARNLSGRPLWPRYGHVEAVLEVVVANAAFGSVTVGMHVVVNCSWMAVDVVLQDDIAFCHVERVHVVVEVVASKPLKRLYESRGRAVILLTISGNYLGPFIRGPSLTTGPCQRSRNDSVRGEL